MRYVIARQKKSVREMAYRIYLTDGLKCANDNLSALLGGHGARLQKRYAEAMGLVDEPEPDSRSMEEIVNSIWDKIESG